jgi:FtsP/CotA-like multicopper oxidase with cupredoxin domain
MGLYGTIVVEPAQEDYWPAVDRHLTITVDDLLVEDGRIAPFHRSGPTYTAMGRYGNVMLTNGQPRFAGQAAVGEVVRLYLVPRQATFARIEIARSSSSAVCRLRQAM